MVDAGRRTFLQNSAFLAGAASLFSVKGAVGEVLKPQFTLAKLPYDAGALAPFLSKETVELHYGKHHGGYVAKLNELVRGTNYAGRNLQYMIKAAAQKPADAAIFNNVAQIYNHDFYWQSMKPQGGGAPTGALQQRIAAAFNSEAGFTQAFLQKSAAHFGSGWLWLVQKNDGSLDLIATSNADIPTHRPLFVMDIWEHAYYVDYRNAKAEYAKLFLDKLVNWEFANQRLMLS